MKITFILFEILLLMCGVFGADKGEVKLVSVMEGDSVTLNSDPTQVIEIRWWFGEPDLKIAQIDDKGISFPSERFKGRLQLSQTGSLTIKNMRINDSGRYKVQINHRNGTSNQEFTVTVSVSPSVIGVDEAERKIVSVTEGDPVTLDVPQIHGDELIVWRFGDEGKLIAKHDIEAKSPLLYSTDERFRDRLQLDQQTGSLIITNSKTTDSGLYQVKISSNKQTLYMRFTVIVSELGVSPGAAAGIVLVLLVAAAVAAGVFSYFRPRISQLPSETLSVQMGDNVTLNPDTEIQTGDEIQWLFGVEDILIAEIKKETGKMITYDGPGRIFNNRLKLDKTTGSLKIKLINTEHTGLYTLKIRRDRKTLYKKFQVSVKERKIEVMEGEDLTLKPAAEINKDDSILWLFGDKELMFRRETGKIFTYDHVAGGIFKDRLELDETTRSLTIRNTTTAHSGLYKLQIRSRSVVLDQTFIVTVKDKVEEKLVDEGESVTLNTYTKIDGDDQILWMFRDKDDLIAQIKGGTGETHDDANERFKGRLKLDNTTGSLTITNISTELTGRYKLQIISSRGILYKKFWVFIKVEEKSVNEGESVTLKPSTKIQRDDQILWMFGDEYELIARISGGTGETRDGDKKRFKDRLKLDNTTGSLTITNISSEHAGDYELKIISSSGKILYKEFNVSMTSAAVTNEVRVKSVMNENNDSTEERVNESVTVVMPLLDGENLDGVNDEEGTSSL